MPSNQYTGSPKVCLLCSTVEGCKPIDLLNRDGISITNPPGWIPQVTKLKGGGVRIGSQSLDDDWLVAGGYEAVTETFPITIDPIDTAARVQGLLARLQEAEQYWIEGWQRDSVYLKVQLTEDHDVRYTRIKTGSYQIQNYAFGQRTGLPNNTLILEHEPYWRGVPPKEMLGPFANWCPNPSFEYWSADGITDTIPTGWYETLVSGSEPASFETRREDQQIAGPKYALDMNFNSAAATGDWRLRTEMSWPGSPETATLRFWLFLILPTATHTFSVRVIDNTGTAVATASFTSDYQGYYYLSTDAPFLDDQVYTVELRWQFAIAGTGGRAVIDHICFTPGEYTAETWPAEDFYLTCSNVWNWEDDEMHYADKAAVSIPRHPLNFFDVSGVPGSAPAIMDLNISHLGKKYGDDKNYPIINYVLGSQVHEAGERSTDERHISMNLDGEGYTGPSEQDVSSESITSAPLSSQYSAIYCWRSDAISETKLYTGRFKAFARVRLSTEASATATLQLEHWIGSQVGLLQQDEVVISWSPTRYQMVNLTPRSVIDWSLQADDPAALGLRLNAKSDGIDPILELDFILLAPMDAGLITTTFDESTPWLVGQAMSVDGTPGHQPVAITAPFFPWVRESSMLLVGEGLTSWLAMDAEAFTGSLYVAVYNVDVDYDYQLWSGIEWFLDESVTDYPTLIIENWDTSALVGAAKMQADGDDLRVFVNGAEVDRWFTGIDTATTDLWILLDFQPEQSGTLSHDIGAGDIVTSITINESTAGFPNSGILVVGLLEEVMTYDSKDDGSKTFLGVQRAAKGTTAVASTTGDNVLWAQHDLWIKYGNPGAVAPIQDDTVRPIFNMATSRNREWDYDEFGDGGNSRAGRWIQTDVSGGARVTFYTGFHTANADPNTEVGITIAAGGGFAGGKWAIYNPHGIIAMNCVGEQRAANKLHWFGRIYSSLDGIAWTVEYTTPAPAVNNVWEAWNRYEAFPLAGETWGAVGNFLSSSGGPNDFEAGDVLVHLDNGVTPGRVIGSEQDAATGKLLRFDHRGWDEVITRDDPIRALETWDAYLYYVQDTTIGRYRVIAGAEDFIIGATPYYDLIAYNGFLWLASNVGKIFYSDNLGNVTESIDLGSQVWWCLETYKRNLYAGANLGDIAVYNPVDGWAILTNFGSNVRTMKAWKGKLYISVSANGVYSYDGDSFVNVLPYAAKYNQMGRLEVYDDLLFVGTGTNGGNAYVLYTEDGINWTENKFPAGSVPMAMEPFDGRLFIGFGWLFGVDEWASEWLLWHTREVPKLYLTEHTGGPFVLYPDRINRYYQMMEVLNVNILSRHECYLERGIGPQTHIGVSFVPRWHALRED